MNGWRRRGYSIAAMRELARRELPRPVFDFADGGAEDERTLRRNEAAFGEIDLVPSPLNGVGEPDLSVELFGSRLKLPVIIGPTGLAGLFWPGGELCSARAAAAAGTAYCLSHGSVATIETLAETGASPRWMQVFIYKDRGFTRELTERAAARATTPSSSPSTTSSPAIASAISATASPSLQASVQSLQRSTPQASVSPRR